MIRMVAFGLFCIIAFHIYYLFRKRLQKTLQGFCRVEAESHVGKRSTLVKDPCTGEYFVR